MCTILGLLAKGDMNCAGAPITNDLFSGNGDNKAQAAARSASPRPSRVHLFEYIANEFDHIQPVANGAMANVAGGYSYGLLRRSKLQ